MLKTLRSISRQEKERLRIPRSVQDLIPIRTIYPDGIFEVAPGKYSRSYRFEDINYAVASGSDKDSMFLKYSDIHRAGQVSDHIGIPKQYRGCQKLFQPCRCGAADAFQQTGIGFHGA